MGKKDIHVWINEELYNLLKNYASQYIEQGYKNWLGRAVEDAIRALLAAQNTNSEKFVTGTGKPDKPDRKFIIIKYNERAPIRIRNRIKRILEKIGDVKSTLLRNVIETIIEVSGSDYRTIAKYLTILQNVYGMKFHKKNKCLVYFDSKIDKDDGIPLTRIPVIDSKVVSELMDECMK